MEILLQRKYPKNTYTIGKISIDGSTPICDALEDKDRGLTQSMPTSEIYKKKCYGSTAIPRGRYRINMNTVSPKFKNRKWAIPYGGIIPRLEGVPAFDGVLIHPGNTPADTYGCILPGWNTVKGKVMNSTKAFDMLMKDYFLPAKARNEEIWITIV